MLNGLVEGGRREINSVVGWGIGRLLVGIESSKQEILLLRGEDKVREGVVDGRSHGVTTSTRTTDRISDGSVSKDSGIFPGEE
jgi:hypothetical protein